MNDFNKDFIKHSLQENVAAISAEFHTHRFYWNFYETFDWHGNGFAGSYQLCIAMAEALTHWEITNGVADAYENAGVTWIEMVENFVDDTLVHASKTGQVPDFPEIISGLRVLQQGGVSAVTSRVMS